MRSSAATVLIGLGLVVGIGGGLFGTALHNSVCETTCQGTPVTSFIFFAVPGILLIV